MMGWVIEDLAGIKNGVNTDFTISQAPMTNSLLVIYQGLEMERVGSQPSLMEYAYTQNGTNVTLGIAPQSAQHAWVRYFF